MAVKLLQMTFVSYSYVAVASSIGTHGSFINLEAMASPNVVLSVVVGPGGLPGAIFFWLIGLCSRTYDQSMDISVRL